MGGVKLDAARTQKMKALEEALLTMQTIHGLVERMALDVKNNRGVGVTPGQIKRIATNLQGQLKAQFGLIADQVAGMIIAMGRGGGEQGKVRVRREAVGQIRTALEINAAKVKKDHAVTIELAPE